KYFVFSAAIGKGYLPLVVIGIINSLFGVYYYFKIIAAMLLKPSDETAVTPPLSYVIVIVLCTLIVVALGIVPDVILSLL
ncbi:MAG: NADH-quinone oxidoreductase subunit N, partial [Candidatus Nephrothrix sp. EaCA]